jgi:hypothetical protein
MKNNPTQVVSAKTTDDTSELRIPLNVSVGDQDLCAWQPARGVV